LWSNRSFHFRAVADFILKNQAAMNLLSGPTNKIYFTLFSWIKVVIIKNNSYFLSDKTMKSTFVIREVSKNEYRKLGQLMVDIVKA
jgi:hypothetical protein